MRAPARIAGLLTIGYSAAIIAKPQVMAKPCGLTNPDGSVPETAGMLIRVIGVRDAVSGLALLVAPPGKALWIAGVVRVASDAGDGLMFGRLLPHADARRKAAAAALGWAGICAASVAAATPDASKRRRLYRKLFRR